MMSEAAAKHKRFNPGEALRSQLGPKGHALIFLWIMVLSLFIQPPKAYLAIFVSMALIAVIYPFAYRQLLRSRFWILFLLLTVPTIFLLGEADQVWHGIRYSAIGLQTGTLVGLRLGVTLLAIQGFTRSVDISTLAGSFERMGLQGLGFAMGVALNLLPGMQEASWQVWQTMRMRGGLRRQWLRGLKLLSVTVMSIALSRAEEIALAAEARAFSPERAHPMPLRKGRLDWLPLPLGLAVMLGVLLI